MSTKSADARLRVVAAAYGADPRRWPEDERAELMAIAADSPNASWMIEAKGIDRALAAAPSATTSPGLRGDIVARAVSTTPMDLSAYHGDIYDFTAASVGRHPPQVSRRFGGMPETALLAASLVVGIWVGGSGLLDTSLSEVNFSATFTETSEAETNALNALIGIPLTDDEGVL